ncbi:MAG: DUF3656 domain-containing protein [Selenomonadaceae bacterium]|nr:DUF3656 domain-containing protein [Selenomonadaceae bacterium]
MLELLAPAGSMEALRAAVESGADAVYLAGTQFGARAYAANFNEEELKAAIRYAHLRGVAVHVTVNTIVDDGEMGTLAEYLRFLYESGADAVLVQDLGVVRVAKKVTPKLPLHASTQMTVHNLAGVEALEELGFARVVLSRELSLAAIKHICAHAKCEIEVFAHGALCICYSGQCLMSSLIGGRSGNRGRCAQPCRLPYGLINEQGQDVLKGLAGEYLLSPRDLNTIDLLPQLVEAGVTSLKIEGRMKRPEYVATVVNAYRYALNRLPKRPSNLDSTDKTIRRELKQIFNRDFTTAYLEKYPGKNLMSDRRPNNRGLLIGRVTGCDAKSRRVTVALSEDLSTGDQVEFWVKVGGRVAATVEEMTLRSGQQVTEAEADEEVTFPLPRAVKTHDRVFKVYDAKLMNRAKALYAASAPVRRIPLDLTVTAAVGEPLVLTMRDGDGYEATVKTDFRGEAAQKRPLTTEILQEQLGRLGGSIFSLRELTADIKGQVMLPLSELNEVRRRGVAALEKRRLEPYRREPLSDKDRLTFLPQAVNKTKKNLLLTVSVDTVPKAKAALTAGADRIIFGGETYNHENLTLEDYKEAWNLARQKGKEIFFHTPRIMGQHEQRIWQALLTGWQEISPDGIYVTNVGVWQLARRLTQLPRWVDYSLISYNSQTLAFWQEQGFMGATLSPELNMEQVAALAARTSLPLECIVHGRLELMVSEYCPLGTFWGNKEQGTCSMPCRQDKYFLRDRKNIMFPLATDQFCRLHLLNSKVLSMLPHAPKFAAMGISSLRLEAKASTTRETHELVSAYKKALTGAIAEEEAENITRGHYFRGVL